MPSSWLFLNYRKSKNMQCQYLSIFILEHNKISFLLRILCQSFDLEYYIVELYILQKISLTIARIFLVSMVMSILPISIVHVLCLTSCNAQKLEFVVKLSEKVLSFFFVWCYVRTFPLHFVSPLTVKCYNAFMHTSYECVQVVHKNVIKLKAIIRS